MSYTITEAEKEPFLKLLRPLVETYAAFLRKDAEQVRRLGLTGSQFDVIATLGDTDGLPCSELSEKTLVTKGTLTGVLDRLVFPAQVLHLKPYFERALTAREMQELRTLLLKLKDSFERADERRR